MSSNALQAVCDLSPVLTCIVKEFEELVKQLWVYAQHNPNIGFGVLEDKARQLRAECFSSALRAAALMHRTQVEEGWLLGRARCSCGGTPQYKGEQARTIQTWVGDVTLTRGYFYCKRCRSGRYPLDEALGIPGGEHFSDEVQQGVCLLGAQMGFEQASHALKVLSGICVSPREAERITEGRGLALEESLQDEGQQLLRASASESKEPIEQAQAGSEEGVWCVSLDAGKVRYQDGWHDAKAGVVFWAEPTPNEAGEVAGGRATKHSQSYIAECGSMEEAGARLAAEAWKRGIGAEQLVVCLGDGAPPNWKQFDEHFPRRVEVLDWYHAMEHLWSAGNGIFGQGTQEAVRWVKQWEGELWEGRVEAVIMALHREGKREGEAGEAACAEIHYFETNRERMRYSDYRTKGYPIGSGTVESACKRLIGARVKGAGMRWSKPGAQGVLTLRAELLSGRWEQSWPNTRMPLPSTKVA